MPLPGPLGSPKNLIALGFGFLAAIVFWVLSPSDSRRQSTPKPAESRLEQNGSNELDRVDEAVRRARAWHVTSTGRFGDQLFQTQEDVVCPSDFHSITHALTASGPGPISEESIAAANTLYEHEGADPWRSRPDPDPNHCQNGPSAGSQKLLSELLPIRRAARVTEGPLIKLSDGTCRLWDISGASNLPFHSICVEESTHYPRRLQIGGLLIEYSKWNQPALIEPPEMPSSHPMP